MRFINIRRSKDLLAVVGGFIGLFIALGSNFFFQRIPEGNKEEFIKDFLMRQSGLIEEIGICSKRPLRYNYWAVSVLGLFTLAERQYNKFEV